MKVIIVSNMHEKLTEFFIKQGSFEVPYSLDNLSSNLDKLKNSVVRVDKLLIVSSDTDNISNEVRALLTLLDSPSGFLSIGEIVFFYKTNSNIERVRALISLVSETIKNKSQADPRWKAPLVTKHEMEVLVFNTVYKLLMGTSSSLNQDVTTKVKYRVERGEDSVKAFESVEDDVVAVPFSTTNNDAYEGLKNILKKTESPATFTDYEKAIPAYDNFKLKSFNVGNVHQTKWLLTTGAALGGVTMHTSVLASSAVHKDYKTLVLDLSKNGGVGNTLNEYKVKHTVISNRDILDPRKIFNITQSDASGLYLFENASFNVLSTLPLFIQNHSNVYAFDTIIVSFSLEDLNLILDSMSATKSVLIFSSMLFADNLNRLLDLDINHKNVLVWLNDHIKHTNTKRTFDVKQIKSLALDRGKSYKFMEPMLFSDLDIDGSIFSAVEGVM